MGISGSPSPEMIQLVWGGTQGFAFLRSSKVLVKQPGCTLSYKQLEHHLLVSRGFRRGDEKCEKIKVKKEYRCWGSA